VEIQNLEIVFIALIYKMAIDSARAQRELQKQADKN